MYAEYVKHNTGQRLQNHPCVIWGYLHSFTRSYRLVGCGVTRDLLKLHGNLLIRFEMCTVWNTLTFQRCYSCHITYVVLALWYEVTLLRNNAFQQWDIKSHCWENATKADMDGPIRCSSLTVFHPLPIVTALRSSWMSHSHLLSHTWSTCKNFPSQTTQLTPCFPQHSNVHLHVTTQQ
jgi:hypothetical protein